MTRDERIYEASYRAAREYPLRLDPTAHEQERARICAMSREELLALLGDWSAKIDEGNA